MFQIVISAFFPPRDAVLPSADSAREAPALMLVPIVLLAILCVVMGLFPQWLLDVIREAVTL